jgi:hypothetical protein
MISIGDLLMSSINRRLLLQSTGVAALGTIFPNRLVATPAAPQNVTQTSGKDSFLANFNGGRTQVGVNALQWGGGYPFLNLLKTAQTWSLNDGSGFPTPDTLDADGYPIKITNGGVYTVFFVPSQASRPGNYVITWSGNGTISLGMNNTRVSGNPTSTNGSGRYVFATTDSRFVFRIVAVGNPHITNLQIFHAADEAALNAGQVFGVKFKQRLQEANFGIIRFLGWQNGNVTNATTWATRKPLSYFSYASNELRANLYAGVTSNVGAAYSATLPGFRLVDKATVIVKFNASCSGPCTMNVSGTGDINVLSSYSEPLDNSSYPIGTGSWRSMATLVYDAILNAWIKFGGDVALGSTGLDAGCPPELMVRLCAEVGAHPYFVTPHLSIDPITDYMPSLAVYCRDHGPAWMVPRFEGPNETWNYAADFYATHHAVAKAKAYGWGADFHNWYGKILSVLGQAVSMVYADDRSRYQVLCGVQTVLADSASGTASCNARLASTKYLSQPAPPQTPYTKSAASNWVTHVCCAQYFGPAAYKTREETQYAASFASVADLGQRAAIATAYANTVNRPWKGNASVLTYCANEYSNWKTWAQRFGIQKMCGYEGGYSADYTGGGKSEVDLLRAASKNTLAVGEFTIENYNNFIAHSHGDFSAEFPSCFLLSGPTPSTNCWSVLEDIYQMSNPPQWDAIVAFNTSQIRAQKKG